MNNPIWLMTSAYPQLQTEELFSLASSMGLQGVELCVFPHDGARKDHVATHLDYDSFTPDMGMKLLEMANKYKVKFSLGAFENLIGGDEVQRTLNQNHLLKLIRIAALLGGDSNGITVGTFVGYNHQWDCDKRSFERNLEMYQKIFTPIIRYAENLGVTILYENCPMEGWRSGEYFNTFNNLSCTLAARKLMYHLIPSNAHGEIYDPSHDIWQFINPVDVLRESDLEKIHMIHIKTTRMKSDSGSIHWGNVFGKQVVSESLASAAGVPLLQHDWDRFSYEPMVPGFGGSDSMDWRTFVETLNDLGYCKPFSIENEGANSRGTHNIMATHQGLQSAMYHIMPMIWPLAEKGYCYDISEVEPFPIKLSKDIPLVTIDNLKF